MSQSSAVDRPDKAAPTASAQLASTVTPTPKAGEPEPATKEISVPDPRREGMQPQVRELLSERRDAVVKDPTDAAAWMNYGIACDAHKLYDCAETCYRQSLSLSPGRLKPTYFLAFVLDAMGRGDDECVNLYHAALKIEPRYPPLYYRLGKALERRGKPSEALDAYLEALNVNYDFGPAHRAAGQVQLSLGETEAALKHLEYAVKLAPRDRASVSALASARGRLGLPRPYSAERIEDETKLEFDIPDPVRNIVRETAVDSATLLRRIKAKIHAGEHAEAIPDLIIVERALPDDPYVNLYLGTCYHRTGDLGLAAAYLKNAVRLKEDSAGAQVEFATLLIEIGRLDEGLYHYDLAVASSPAPRDIHIWVGATLFATGHMKYAAEAYESAFKIASLDAKSFARWGMALFRLGDYVGAAEKFKRATYVDPGYVDAFYNRGISLERAGKVDEAVTQYQKVLSLEPDHPKAGERLKALASGNP